MGQFDVYCMTEGKYIAQGLRDSMAAAIKKDEHVKKTKHTVVIEGPENESLDTLVKKVRQLHEAVVSGMIAGPIAMMGRAQKSHPIQTEGPQGGGTEVEVSFNTVIHREPGVPDDQSKVQIDDIKRTISDAFGVHPGQVTVKVKGR